MTKKDKFKVSRLGLKSGMDRAYINEELEDFFAENSQLKKYEKKKQKIKLKKSLKKHKFHLIFSFFMALFLSWLFLIPLFRLLYSDFYLSSPTLITVIITGIFLLFYTLNFLVPKILFFENNVRKLLAIIISIIVLLLIKWLIFQMDGSLPTYLSLVGLLLLPIITLTLETWHFKREIKFPIMGLYLLVGSLNLYLLYGFYQKSILLINNLLGNLNGFIPATPIYSSYFFNTILLFTASVLITTISLGVIRQLPQILRVYSLYKSTIIIAIISVMGIFINLMISFHESTFVIDFNEKSEILADKFSDFYESSSELEMSYSSLISKDSSSGEVFIYSRYKGCFLPKNIKDFESIDFSPFYKYRSSGKLIDCEKYAQFWKSIDLSIGYSNMLTQELAHYFIINDNLKRAINILGMKPRLFKKRIQSEGNKNIIINPFQRILDIRKKIVLDYGVISADLGNSNSHSGTIGGSVFINKEPFYGKIELLDIDQSHKSDLRNNNLLYSKGILTIENGKFLKNKIKSGEYALGIRLDGFVTPEKFYNEPFVSDKEIWDKYYISAKSLPNKITIEEGKDLDLGEINIFIQEKPLENTPRLRNVKKSKEEVNNILIPTDLTIDISI